ncbi:MULTISPECIES: DUF397 domain-containing protein [unclassified Streptomyces]|uniref:DUF397 domain-containing protein n=1 Tax=unclassified Streptomyces TaxID=2593676 RepID=UPI003819B9CA
MAQPSTGRADLVVTGSAWRKSSYSSHNGDCVEVAELGEAMALRDSKNARGPVVSVSRQAMAVFVGALAGGTMASGRH